MWPRHNYLDLATGHTRATALQFADSLLVDWYMNQPFQYWDYLRPKHKNAKIFESYLNPVMLVSIG